MDLLKKEGISYEQQEKLFDTPPVLSQRYKDVGLVEAIMDVLKGRDQERLGATEIYTQLIKNGFTSNSSNIKRDVYSRLSNLGKEHKVGATKKRKGHPKKYYWLKAEGEKAQGVTTEVTSTDAQRATL